MGAMSPTMIAFTAAALAWPLLAGLGVVAWSRSRAAARSRQVAAVDRNLRQLYRQVEARGAPRHLTMVIDALEEGEALAAARAGETTTKPVTTA